MIKGAFKEIEKEMTDEQKECEALGGSFALNARVEKDPERYERTRQRLWESANEQQ